MSVNKTMALEAVEELRGAIEAADESATFSVEISRGFSEYHDMGWVHKVPNVAMEITFGGVIPANGIVKITPAHSA